MLLYQRFPIACQDYTLSTNRYVSGLQTSNRSCCAAMTIVIHHLQRSSSERIPWLLEELGVPYDIRLYRRDQKTLRGPPEMKALHPTGTTGMIEDADVKITETGAVMEYILGRYGDGRLSVQPSATNFAEYVFWFHWGIGSLMHIVELPLYLRFAGVAEDSPSMRGAQERLAAALTMIDNRLKSTKWLAGNDFTAADIYCVFPLSTMRLFASFDLKGYDGLLRWLRDVSERPAYRKAMNRAEYGETRGGQFPVIYPDAPKSMFG
ncbi:Glutathione S-transferase [Macrophomina phaseolina MS6]|uniref:Glutathione S-transferase n=1 Tax=Macrophomina phaseolina (strain MS6) TaxID=1126212 RepID=K2RXM3_MACPH|nr:Glutathione S-transferase [Macrophomina phaseolina MS6]